MLIREIARRCLRICNLLPPIFGTDVSEHSELPGAPLNGGKSGGPCLAGAVLKLPKIEKYCETCGFGAGSRGEGGCPPFFAFLRKLIKSNVSLALAPANRSPSRALARKRNWILHQSVRNLCNETSGALRTAGSSSECREVWFPTEFHFPWKIGRPNYPYT